ncbi:GtrA family protein [Rhodopseudomonas palustris]
MKHLLDRLVAAWHRRDFWVKAVSFALVGVINAFIDLGVFLVFYDWIGVPLVASNVLAWAVAVSCSYIMNSFTTFGRESGGKLRLRDYLKFVVSGIAGVTAATTTLVVLSLYLPVLTAKLVSILVSFVVNFSLSHFVVFRRSGDGGVAG